MNLVFRVFFTLFLILTLFACKPNRLKVDISESKQDIEFVRFDNELFSFKGKDTLEELVALHNKYSDFFDLFSYKVIKIGGIDDEDFPELIKTFLTDTMIQNVHKLAEIEFPDFEKTASEINKAFKYYQYYYPGKKLPVVYAYISGFNQSVVTADKIIGIGLDKYLGRDCHYYRQLVTTPQYKTINMHKKKITSDVVYAWGMTEFEETNKANNLIGNMIHQGKLMYFVDALLPDTNDTLKIGYTKKQLDWCKKNEPQMWLNLVENKMLYSSQRMDILRYINDGPYTSGFPLESPARTGIWIGWQIVRQFMEKHPEVTLNQLMLDSDYQSILNGSGYFPE